MQTVRRTECATGQSDSIYVPTQDQLWQHIIFSLEYEHKKRKIKLGLNTGNSNICFLWISSYVYSLSVRKTQLPQFSLPISSQHKIYRDLIFLRGLHI